jgi:hypothetical protein
MGQRNATYVIIQYGKEKKSFKTILPIYNQWNYPEVQAAKMVRGIKAVLAFSNPVEVRFSNAPLDMIYFTNAGTFTDVIKGKNKTQWVGGSIETDLYKDGTYTGAFQEDNNNGWNIVKFIIDFDNDRIQTEIYCVVGKEDKSKINSLSLTGYFNTKETKRSDISYLKEFNWNKSLVKESKELIKKLIDDSKLQEVYLLTSDTNGTVLSGCDSIGVAVKTEEEAKKFLSEKSIGYENSYEKINIFETTNQAVSSYKNKLKLA